MASRWQKTLAVVAASVAGLSGLAGGVYYMLMRRPLPKIKGKLLLRGLHEPVEVITDWSPEILMSSVPASRAIRPHCQQAL